MTDCLHLQIITTVRVSGEFTQRTLRCATCRCRLELDEQGVYQAKFLFDVPLQWQTVFTRLNADIFQAMSLPAKVFRYHAGGDSK